MITKDEVNQKLKRMGYQVANDSSIITILIPTSVSLKKTIKEVKEKLTLMEYTASFSIKQYKEENAGNLVESESTSYHFDEDTEENRNNEEEMQELLNENSVQFSLEDFGIGF